jgi:hypothetical protein
MTQLLDMPRAAFSIDEFCARNGVSRGSLYNWWRAGTVSASARRRVRPTSRASTASRRRDRSSGGGLDPVAREKTNTRPGEAGRVLAISST